MKFYTIFPVFSLFLLVQMVSGNVEEKENEEEGDQEIDKVVKERFQGHMDAFVSGMKDELKEIGKQAEEQTKKGKQEPADGLAQLLSPEKVNDFIANFLPDRVKAFVPKDWLLKIIQILFMEGNSLLELFNVLDKIGTMDEFWSKLAKKTPITAQMLDEIWAAIKNRWNTFNGGLNDESKQYMEKVKTSFWTWLTRHVVGPYIRLSTGAKDSLMKSAASAYPGLAPIVAKAMANKRLMEWAMEWHRENEEKLAKEQEGQGGKAADEESMMAQLKAMMEKFNFDDMMMGDEGGMEDEERKDDEKKKLKKDVEEEEAGEGSGRDETRKEEAEEEKGTKEAEEDPEGGQCSAEDATEEKKCTVGEGKKDPVVVTKEGERDTVEGEERKDEL